ncbi:MAG: carbon-nitrogen hydrolase family protein [Candidatus Eremiobacterota bacterium]
MRAAVVQMNSGVDPEANLERAARMVEEAASQGARLVVLPEVFTCRGDRQAALAAAEAPGGATLQWARSLARAHRVWLVAGSFLEREPGDGDRAGNVSYLVGPDAEVHARYRKVHLFDVELPEFTHRESDSMVSGEALVLGKVDGAGLGLTICYDLRFPEVYRALTLAGARMAAVPSAFTERTGRDHWEVLLRARAIENQIYVLAAGQFGPAHGLPNSYGRSMIVDPWGVVLAQCPDREGVALAELDFEAQDRVRRSLPCLEHRRPRVYSGFFEVVETD